MDQLRVQRHLDDLRRRRTIRVLWGGTANDITAIHEWRFDETSSGTHVTTNESFAGVPVNADEASMQTLLDNSLQAWLGHLKAAAESQT